MENRMVSKGLVCMAGLWKQAVTGIKITRDENIIRNIRETFFFPKTATMPDSIIKQNNKICMNEEKNAFAFML